MITETKPRRQDTSIHQPEPNGKVPKPIPALQRKSGSTLYPETIQAIGELFANAVGKEGKWMFE